VRRDDLDGVGVTLERVGCTHGRDARQIRGGSGDPLCLLAIDGQGDRGVAVRRELRPEGLVDLAGRGRARQHPRIDGREPDAREGHPGRQKQHRGADGDPARSSGDEPGKPVPAMVPMWFFPITIAAGNTVVLKPSGKVPSAALWLARLWADAGLPEGAFNVLHGDKVAVERLLTHPDIKAVTAPFTASRTRSRSG
jgi:hypothetical protein